MGVCRACMRDVKHETSLLESDIRTLARYIEELEDSVTAAKQIIAEQETSLRECKAIVEMIITGPVNQPARITEKLVDLHRRLP